MRRFIAAVLTFHKRLLGSPIESGIWFWKHLKGATPDLPLPFFHLGHKIYWLCALLPREEKKMPCVSFQMKWHLVKCTFKVFFKSGFFLSDYRIRVSLHHPSYGIAGDFCFSSTSVMLQGSCVYTWVWKLDSHLSCCSSDAICLAFWDRVPHWFGVHQVF